MDEILKALTLAVATLAAAWARRGKIEASAANDAVNHRPDPSSPRLYDLVLENREKTNELLEWRDSYQGGPLDSGEKVERFVAEFERLRKFCDDCPEATTSGVGCPECEKRDECGRRELESGEG